MSSDARETEIQPPADWRSIADDPPPDGVVVETMVRETHPPRLDHTHLPLARVGWAWRLPGGEIHYRRFPPTHWRPLS